MVAGIRPDDEAPAAAGADGVPPAGDDEGEVAGAGAGWAVGEARRGVGSRVADLLAGLGPWVVEDDGDVARRR